MVREKPSPCMLSWDINKCPPKKGGGDLNILDCLHTRKLTVHAFAQGTPAAQGCIPREKSSNTRKTEKKNIRHFQTW